MNSIEIAAKKAYKVANAEFLEICGENMNEIHFNIGFARGIQYQCDSEKEHRDSICKFTEEELDAGDIQYDSFNGN